jgi:ankyrin repeat protein
MDEHRLCQKRYSIKRLNKLGHADPTLYRNLDTNIDNFITRNGGATLLEWMCYMNREDMMKIVLKKFPHILDKENYGNTQLHPLCISLQYNRPDIANLLIDHIPANQINHQSWPEKKSALHYASRCTTPTLLGKLIENNADVNAIDVELITPLHIAAVMGRTENCIALLSAGANNTPAFGICPADLSYNQNHLATTLEILERTQSINKLHHKGKSFAHKAAANPGQIEFFVQLVNKGANINLRSSMATKGKTPLHEAARAGNVRMVEKLVELGADTKKRDYAGRTALDFAIRNQNAALVALLTPQ